MQKVAPILAGTFLVSGPTLSLPGWRRSSVNSWSSSALSPAPDSRFAPPSPWSLSALYVLWMYQRMMTGPVKEGNEGVHDLVPRELLVVAPLIVLLIGLGIYPKIALDVINPPSPDPDLDPATRPRTRRRRVVIRR